MKKYFSVKNIGLFFSTLTSVAFCYLGLSKIIPTSEMISNFNLMNLSNIMQIVGIFEVLGSILLSTEKYSKYGVYLLTYIMVGAITIHLSLFDGQGIIIPIILFCTTWIGHLLKTKNYAE